MKNIIVPILVAVCVFASCKTADKNRFRVKLTYKNGDKLFTPANTSKCRTDGYFSRRLYTGNPNCR